MGAFEIKPAHILRLNSYIIDKRYRWIHFEKGKILLFKKISDKNSPFQPVNGYSV